MAEERGRRKRRSKKGLVVTVLVKQSHATVLPVQHMIDRAGFDGSGRPWQLTSLSRSSPGANTTDVLIIRR